MKSSPKFKYEIFMDVEAEQCNQAGRLFWPTCPSVKRLPQGWQKGRQFWSENRKLATEQSNTRPRNCLEQVTKKLKRYRLKYQAREELREVYQNNWKGNTFVKELVETQHFIIIENL
jgi:hypothetical protein